MCVHVLCFFFFKQKTAYEMRISDWSSDVCSSDLMKTALDSDDSYNIKIELNDDPADGSGSAPTTFTFKGLVMSFTANLGSRDQIIGASVGIEKIGRASCRERVCQYV